MNAPSMFETRPVATDIAQLAAYIPVPGMGVLPVNSFLIRAEQPVLVDTGLAALREDYMHHLRQAVEPADLRWIWITHTDPDHLGNLEAVLAEAPRARIVTTFLGMGKLGLHRLPLDRVYLLNPGQWLDVGDRRLLACTPPTYDAPETTALFDAGSRTLFSADCFGAILSEPRETAAAVNPAELRDGLITWAGVDAPWLRGCRQAHLKASLDAVLDLNVATVLSSHLPPAQDMTARLVRYLNDARSAPAFEGPDQAALERMMSAA